MNIAWGNQIDTHVKQGLRLLKMEVRALLEDKSERSFGAPKVKLVKKLDREITTILADRHFHCLEWEKNISTNLIIKAHIQISVLD